MSKTVRVKSHKRKKPKNEREIDDKTWKLMRKIAHDIEEIWDENYYKSKKYVLIDDYITKNKLEGIVRLEKRGIAAKPGWNWFGWKGINDKRTEPQYRMRYYGGWVMAIIFDLKKIKKLKRR